MNWKELKSIDALEELVEASKNKPVVLFKHSTRCSISAAALDRIERKWQSEFENKIQPVYLDLLAHREISNEIAKKFHIEHESPQAIVLKNGKAIYHASHIDIRLEEIMKYI